MTTKITQYILLSLTIATILIGSIAYPSLPDQIASHWNAAGEVDGYMGKFWGMFLIPVMMISFFVLYWAIPRIDPLKKNITSFEGGYNGLWIAIFVFFAYVFGLQLAWNMGARFDFGQALIFALAVLWYVIGSVIERAKRNWFVGIRTPWTLSSDVVWEKTHRLGGQLFKIAAVMALIGATFSGMIAIVSVLAPITLVVLITVVYSYMVYRQNEKKDATS